jgi:hypothetical protein
MLGSLCEFLPPHAVAQTRVHSGGKCRFDGGAASEGQRHDPRNVFGCLHRTEFIESERASLVRVLIQSRDQMLLGGEIPVNGWNGHTRFLRNQRNRQLRDSIACHDLHKTVQNPGSGLDCTLVSQGASVYPFLFLRLGFRVHKRRHCNRQWVYNEKNGAVVALVLVSLQL